MPDPMIIYLMISIFFGMIVSMVLLNWMFRDGEDTNQAMQEFCESHSRRRWQTRFGLWLGLSVGAGALCFHWLPIGWQKVAALF